MQTPSTVLFGKGGIYRFGLTFGSRFSKGRFYDFRRGVLGFFHLLFMDDVLTPKVKNMEGTNAKITLITYATNVELILKYVVKNAYININKGNIGIFADTRIPASPWDREIIAKMQTGSARIDKTYFLRVFGITKNCFPTQKYIPQMIQVISIQLTITTNCSAQR